MTTPNADLVQSGVGAKIEKALPVGWAMYIRRDTRSLAGDKYPRAYVIGGGSTILEEETDNRDLVGYRVLVVLEIREAAVGRTDPDPDPLVRQLVQAVYTDQYPGLSVEEVLLDLQGVPIPEDIEQGITARAFAVTLGLIEERCPAEATP